MTPRYVLAIDQGTTSTRAILFDHDGIPVATGQREHAQHFPRAGWVEHDAAEIRDNTVAVIREALDAAPWSGYMGGGVTPLAPAARGKYLRAEVLLEGTTYATPELLSLEVTRATPAAGMPCDLWRLY